MCGGCAEGVRGVCGGCAGGVRGACVGVRGVVKGKGKVGAKRGPRGLRRSARRGPGGMT